MENFNIGDRVEVISRLDRALMAGRQGTLVYLNPCSTGYQVQIEFDEPDPNLCHDGMFGHKTSDARCRAGFLKEIRLVSEQEVTYSYKELMLGCEV